MISIPAMVSSESAHRLAIRLAMKGRRVVYICPNEFERVWAMRKLRCCLPRVKFWFWPILWKFSSHRIKHPSGGQILFVGDCVDRAREKFGEKIDLEVHV